MIVRCVLLYLSEARESSPLTASSSSSTRSNFAWSLASVSASEMPVLTTRREATISEASFEMPWIVFLPSRVLRTVGSRDGVQ